MAALGFAEVHSLTAIADLQGGGWEKDGNNCKHKMETKYGDFRRT